jgi:hypothetical protein
MAALLVNTDQFYWKTLPRLLVILRSLGIKKDTGLWVSFLIRTKQLEAIQSISAIAR